MLLLEISGFGWSSKGDKGYPENTRHLLILKCPKKPEEIQTTSLFPEQRQCLQPSSKSYPGELGSKLETIISSVQFSLSVVSDSLRPHESQHARPPCPSPFPRVHSNSHPTSRWCHPAVLSSVVPFSSCPQSLPASESFPMSQLFSWGGQSTRVLALASVLPKNTRGWSLEWTGWNSLQSKGLSRLFPNTTVQKHQFFSTQLFTVQLSHPYMTTGKTIGLTRWTFVELKPPQNSGESFWQN